MTNTSINYFLNIFQDEKDLEVLSEEKENRIIVFIKTKKEKNISCPHCDSTSIVVKDYLKSYYPFGYNLDGTNQIELYVSKVRYKCKTCNRTFYKNIDVIINKFSKIPNLIARKVYILTKELRSFDSIAKELNISTTTVINLFDKNVSYGRQALPYSLSIDEKKFKTYYGKYICVLSNSLNGKIIDILESRKSDYIFEYFSKIPPLERLKVIFFVSDMFEGYRKIKKIFFPKAIHVIDKFHITKLFTDKLQIIRKSYMNKELKKSKEYYFLKTKWRLFLLNPLNKKYQKLSEKCYYDENGEIINFEYELQKYLKKFPDLLEINLLYKDFCRIVRHGLNDEELLDNIEFIIKKALGSLNENIRIIGKTLNDFSEEIFNTYSSSNNFQISNARAESINNKIGKLIAISNGYKNFDRFRTRILHIQNK